jgi:hypothetical protein
MYGVIVTVIVFRITHIVLQITIMVSRAVQEERQERVLAKMVYHYNTLTAV